MEDDLDYNSLALRQALWDVYAALGFDTDGDKTPAGVQDLRRVVVNAAKVIRSDYDALLDEVSGLIKQTKQLSSAAKRLHG
jgi:hypothetical protein